MPNITESDWLDILDDIQDQKAVLLIGPEIMQVAGQPLNRHLRDSLYARNEADIAFYYERDGFFLFKSPEGKVRVARQVKFNFDGLNFAGFFSLFGIGVN